MGDGLGQLINSTLVRQLKKLNSILINKEGIKAWVNRAEASKTLKDRTSSFSAAKNIKTSKKLSGDLTPAIIT